MSDYDNGFKRAQQMYDAQEEPVDEEPRKCPNCRNEMSLLGTPKNGFRMHCPNCGYEEEV